MSAKLRYTAGPDPVLPPSGVRRPRWHGPSGRRLDERHTVCCGKHPRGFEHSTHEAAQGRGDQRAKHQKIECRFQPTIPAEVALEDRLLGDHFEFYEKVTRRVFGQACLYGQVLRTRRYDRVIQVERIPVIGSAWRFEAALFESKDSSTLNSPVVTIDGSPWIGRWHSWRLRRER